MTVLAASAIIATTLSRLTHSSYIHGGGRKFLPGVKRQPSS
jgi:hypothetical protein